INLFLFNLLYGNKNRYVLNYDDFKVEYSTEDAHSKHYFFPRYAAGVIHEPTVTREMVKNLKNSKVFVDVGTHLGYFTCLAGKILENGRVDAFEVEKNAFALLKKNLDLNELKNVNVYNVAVTDKKGTIKIPLQSKPSPFFSIVGNDKDSEFIEVDAIALDDFYSKKDYQPDVVKIDVEGAEMQVLQGMKSLLETRDLVLFIELHGNVLPEFGGSSKEVINYLIDKGYLIYEIENPHDPNLSQPSKIARDTQIDYNTVLYVTKKEI
ncbi:MAG: FkbM family methyltransferase, partial [Candidatus Woesearchaeota archaeon]|nr:FkbM family methyltransferase [Candidatus Woesearchaeota archaeon]